MKLFLLAVFGPWQLIFLLGLIAFIVVPIILIVSRAKHKTRADLLDQQVREANRKNMPLSDDERFERLERLQKLRESGALSEAEFEAEKRKLL